MRGQVTVHLVDASELRSCYVRLALRYGAAPDEANLFADAFVEADLRGHSTQGIGYVPLVAEWLHDGVVSFGRTVTTLFEGPAFAVLDAHHGLGQVVAPQAMDVAIAKAGIAGLGAVWLRNTNDFTMAAAYAMRALEHGMVGIAMSNGSPEAAPWGGTQAVFGTNPIAVAIPSTSGAPIVIDMATSSVSHGEAVRAARDHRDLDWPALVTPGGRLTARPHELIPDARHREAHIEGAIAALGPKGFGWLLVVELFAGILSGMEPSSNNTYPPTLAEPAKLGQTFLAIDVDAVVGHSEFARRVDDLRAAIHHAVPAEGFDRVVLPGEAAWERSHHARRHGIPIRPEEWHTFVTCAERAGVDTDACLLSIDSDVRS